MPLPASLIDFDTRIVRSYRTRKILLGGLFELASKTKHPNEEKLMLVTVVSGCKVPLLQQGASDIDRQYCSNKAIKGKHYRSKKGQLRFLALRKFTVGG